MLFVHNKMSIKYIFTCLLFLRITKYAFGANGEKNHIEDESFHYRIMNGIYSEIGGHDKVSTEYDPTDDFGDRPRVGDISDTRRLLRRKRAVDPSLHGISFDERVAMLKEHNRYRGLTNGLSMLRIKWDTKLASLAQAWADNCMFKYSKAEVHGTEWRSIGENIFAVIGDADWNKTNAVQAWNNEVEFYDTVDHVCQTGKYCDHYSQLTWHSTDKVGCGFSNCPVLGNSDITNAYFVVCNYGPSGNVPKENPYDNSLGPMSVCSVCVDYDGMTCFENKYCYWPDCKGKTCNNGGILLLDVCECNCIGTEFTGEFCSERITSIDKQPLKSKR